MKKQSILFVCLGNICRSPLAEGVFRHLVEARGLADSFLIDSCGTGSWHVGEPPHVGSREIAEKNGVSLAGIRARQLSESDFSKFDLLVAMDRENLRTIKQAARRREVNACCLREYDEDFNNLDVPDPYYTGNFHEVFEIVRRCCESLLDEVTER